VSGVEIVNPVPVGEIAPWLASMATTFLGDPAEASAEAPGRAASWDPARAWGAREAGRWVATLRTLPRSITAPGRATELAIDALTNVTVAATHRRQGLLTTMLTESLQAAKDRGDAVSALIAAEWPIYGRFGYAPASDSARYTVRTRDPGSRLLGPARGTVRQVEPEELGRLAPGVFADARPRRAGNIDRPAYWWDRELGLNGVTRPDKKPIVHVVHEGAYGVDGYVSWLSTGHWSLMEDLGQIDIHDLIAANDDAYLALWHYLFGIDVIDRIHLHDRPVDEPLHWLRRCRLAGDRSERSGWRRFRRGPIPARRRDGRGSMCRDDPQRGYSRPPARAGRELPRRRQPECAAPDRDGRGTEQ
jgi:predicted N-acetyltransferase YhbS